MSDRFVKHEVKITVSKEADYSNPLIVFEDEDPIEIQDEAAEVISGLEIGTGAETFMRTDRYSVLKLLRIKNKDTSNYVTVSYTDMSGTACVNRVSAGQELSIPAVNPTVSPSLIASGAAVLIDVILVGET